MERNKLRLALASWCILLSAISIGYCDQEPPAQSPPSNPQEAPPPPSALKPPDTYSDGSPKYNPKTENRKEYWKRVEEWRKKAYPAPKEWKPRYPGGVTLKSLFGNDIYLPPPPDLDHFPKMPKLDDFPKMPEKPKTPEK